jgi:cytochrome c553
MYRLPLLMLFLLLSSPLALAQGKPLATPPKSGQCTACHGRDGQSPSPANPILRCQHQAYLVSALNAYRNGNRKHPIMNAMANSLQPKDIQTLASWYANQPGCKP